jgi:cell division protein FtsQ
MIPVVIGVFVFANQKAKEDVCEKLEINVHDSLVTFVTKQDIENVFANNKIRVNTTKIKDINIQKIEDELKSNPWISETSIYVNSNHTLFANVKQKIPVIRIQQADSNSYGYYLDSLGNPIELSLKYIAKVPVVTSHKLGFTETDLNIKSNLVTLSNFLKKDTFWNTMIGQIALNKNNEVELVPQLGNQLIQFGKLEDNMPDKFNRLYAFYKQGINKVPWNSYNEIDVRYKNQVICRNTNGEIATVVIKNKTPEKEAIAKQPQSHTTHPVVVGKKTPIIVKKHSEEAIVKSKIAPSNKLNKKADKIINTQKKPAKK